ncbi:MAG TPA: hypothetical protein PKA64_24045, partial [Myxococcota bacterium]|nr:hypothetical protein [Myxococcota bacterium]
MSKTAIPLLLSTLAPVTAAHAALPPDFVVDQIGDSADAAPGDGLCLDEMGRCSLRAAVQEANALGGAWVIDLMPGAVHTLSIAGAGEDAAETGDIDVTANLRLQGFGATLDAAALDRALDVQPGGALFLQDLDVVGGAVHTASGGAIRNAGDLRLMDCAVRGSSAVGAGASGGGIFNDRGFLQLTRTVISGNSAERAGGGIEANEGTTLLLVAELLDNTTGPGPGNGGGLHLTGPGDVQVGYSTVSGNTASREGGGMWNSSTGTMSVFHSQITDNAANGAAADDGGGGLFNDGGALVVTDSAVERNTATTGSGSGGGLFNLNGDLYLWRVTVSGNTASRAGGGVEANAGTTTLLESFLTDNMTGPSPGNGGGLHLTGAGDVHLERVRVIGNVASAEGGGVWSSSTGTMTLNMVYVAQNRASGALSDQGGGGVFNDGGTMVIEGSQIVRNVADGAAGSGGGVFNALGDLHVTRTTIARNTAVRAGGGVEALQGRTSLDRVQLNGNTAGSAPGNGGGLHLTGQGTVEVSGSWFTSNAATAEGGGLWCSSTGAMTVVQTSFRSNT